MILPETAAQKLLVSHGRVVGVRTGDKGRDREGGELGELRGRLATSSRRSRCSPRGRRATSPASRSTASTSAARSRRCGSSA